MLINPELSLEVLGEFTGVLVINRAVSVFQFNNLRSRFAKRLRAETASQDRVFVVVRWAIFLRPAQCKRGSKGDEKFETPLVSKMVFYRTKFF